MTSAQQRSDTFWEMIEAQLAETDPDIEVERDAFYSQPEWDVFRMRSTSAGGHRLFAWLSVPKEGGPFPALIRMPDYASVHDIIYTPLRHRAVVMNATHRGQRNSDGGVRASYPGLLTDGIESPTPTPSSERLPTRCAPWTFWARKGSRNCPAQWRSRAQDLGPAWRWLWQRGDIVYRR